MNKKSVIILISLVLIIFISLGLIFSSQKNDSEKYDLSFLEKELSSDGQKLLDYEIKSKQHLDSANTTFTKENKEYWYKNEYISLDTNRKLIPKSPKQNIEGKKIILITGENHPYWSAYTTKIKDIANAFSIELKIYNSEWNFDKQNLIVDQAIREKPDMIIIAPLSSGISESMFSKINSNGIPIFISNQHPSNELMKYAVAFSGPDDWKSSRLLARELADRLDKKGNYVIVRHIPGTPTYISRTYGVITELKEYAPDMKLLDMDNSNLDSDTTMKLVSKWLLKYGNDLNGIVSSDDNFAIMGIIEALKQANRSDVVVVANGNSKIGMNAVMNGDIDAVSYQSAEGDAALVMYNAISWYEGKDIEEIKYLPSKIITKENVEDFLPAQW